MAITKNTRDRFTGETTTETLYKGRVVRVLNVVETRNWSDTLDYTDYRSTNCTIALVYLGREGKKPHGHHAFGRGYVNDCSWTPVGPLDVGDRFAWVDCTNLFSDLYSYWLDNVTVDSVGDLFLACGAEVYDELAAWDDFNSKEAEKAAEQRRLEETRRQAEAKANAEKAAIKRAKDEGLKAEAEKMLAHIPAKGTTVTVDGFTGQVFWTGVTKYYGKWSARAGIKDARGNVAWVTAEKF